MADTINDAGTGVDLARRAILAYCDEGDRGAIRVINAAESQTQLGYAAAYLIDALRGYAGLLTGSRAAAIDLLRGSCEGTTEDAVIAEARLILTEAGEDR